MVPFWAVHEIRSQFYIGPPLSKVSCVPGREKNGQSGGRDFIFFLISFFIDLNIEGEKVKTIFFLAHPARGQETTFYSRVA